MNIEGFKIGAQTNPVTLEHIAGMTASGMAPEDRADSSGYRKRFRDAKSEQGRMTRVTGGGGGFGTTEYDPWKLFVTSGALASISPAAAETVDYLRNIPDEIEFEHGCPCYECFHKNTSRGTGLRDDGTWGESYNDIEMCETEGDIAALYASPRHNKTLLLPPQGRGNCDCMRDMDPHNDYTHIIERIEGEIELKRAKLQSVYCEGKQEVRGGKSTNIADLRNTDWGGGCSDIEPYKPGPSGGSSLSPKDAEDLCNNSYESTDGAYCKWGEDLIGDNHCSASENFCDESNIDEFLDNLSDQGVSRDYSNVHYANQEHKRIPEGWPSRQPPWARPGTSGESANTHTLRRLLVLFETGDIGGCPDECWEEIRNLSRKDMIKVLEELDLEYSEHNLKLAHAKLNSLIKSKENFDNNHLLIDDDERHKRKREYIVRTHALRRDENYHPKCTLKDNVFLDDNPDFDDYDEMRSFCDNDRFHNAPWLCNNYSENICEYRDIFKYNALTSDQKENWNLETECLRQFTPEEEATIRFFGDPESYPDGFSRRNVWTATHLTGGPECSCRVAPKEGCRS